MPSKTKANRRAALSAAAQKALRAVCAQTALVRNGLAARMGLHSTDMACVEWLHTEPLLTPGDLARRTGLTTGAITALIDRLERANVAGRLQHPDDRRSLVVEPMPHGVALMRELTGPLTRKMDELNSRYTEAQLTVVVDYLTRARELAAAHAQWLRDGGAGQSDQRRL
jgi:DNA-binding MarR family transcriptional regulator